MIASHDLETIIFQRFSLSLGSAETTRAAIVIRQLFGGGRDAARKQRADLRSPDSGGVWKMTAER